MFRILAVALLATFASFATCLDINPGEVPSSPAEDEALRQCFSELVGLQIGSQIGTQIKQLRLDEATVLTAFQAALKGEKTMPTDEKEVERIAREYMGRILPKVMEQQGAEWKAGESLPATVNDDFYAAFIKQDGVTVTASGLAYQMLKPGEGAKPTTSDTVRVHYTGRHSSGAIFDSSVEKGTPLEFAVTGVIKGWTEGLQLMPVGSKYRLVIPAELAYGPLQEGSRRPTGILIFDVELLDIVKK